MKSIILVLGLATILGGCKKRHADEAAAPTAAASNSMAGSADGSAMTGSGSAANGTATAAPAADLPTSVDFEDQASKDVTDSNLEAKLGALEKQLAN